MRSRPLDEITIDRWRLEPRIGDLELTDEYEQEQAPPLWKDLALASLGALALWVAAAAIFG